MSLRDGSESLRDGGGGRRQRAEGVVDPALGHAYHGEVDAAFEALDRALDRRSMHVVFHPRFDPIRHDPRWRRVLERLGVDRHEG